MKVMLIRCRRLPRSPREPMAAFSKPGVPSGRSDIASIVDSVFNGPRSGPGLSMATVTTVPCSQDPAVCSTRMSGSVCKWLYSSDTLVKSRGGDNIKSTSPLNKSRNSRFSGCVSLGCSDSPKPADGGTPPIPLSSSAAASGACSSPSIWIRDSLWDGAKNPSLSSCSSTSSSGTWISPDTSGAGASAVSSCATIGTIGSATSGTSSWGSASTWKVGSTPSPESATASITGSDAGADGFGREDRRCLLVFPCRLLHGGCLSALGGF